MTQPFQKGDKVKVDNGFGKPIGDKEAIVNTCYEHEGCQSGWFVIIDIYSSPLDSSWVTKIKDNE